MLWRKATAIDSLPVCMRVRLFVWLQSFVGCAVCPWQFRINFGNKRGGESLRVPLFESLCLRFFCWVSVCYRFCPLSAVNWWPWVAPFPAFSLFGFLLSVAHCKVTSLPFAQTAITQHGLIYSESACFFWLDFDCVFVNRLEVCFGIFVCAYGTHCASPIFQVRQLTETLWWISLF